jgi:tRNA(Ile)-lysidine synthase
MEIESILKNSIENYTNKRYFLAVSAGVDSMVLLHLFLQQKLNITVLHVNYQLRDEASDLDQELVEKVCTKNNIPYIVHVVEKDTLKERSSGNLQQLARTIRYDFFAETMKNHPDSFLVLGHHKNDQAETLLLNLDRKPGIIGLSGMLTCDQNKLRPLLTYSKTDIYKIAKAEKLVWREDQSNQKSVYKRNFIRNEVLPIWEKHQEDIVHKLAATTHFYQKIQAEIELRILEIIGSDKKISAVVFEKMLSIEKAEVLRQWNFPIHFIDEITTLTSSQVGKYVESGNQRIYRERAELHCVKQETDKILPSIKIENVAIYEKGDTSVAYLDEQQIVGKLRLRTWQIGDKMQVLGMRQSKLVSDILANEKVESHLKSNYLVLEDDQIIHWLVGIRVSEISKVRSNTQNILKISLFV